MSQLETFLINDTTLRGDRKNIYTAENLTEARYIIHASLVMTYIFAN